MRIVGDGRERIIVFPDRRAAPVTGVRGQLAGVRRAATGGVVGVGSHVVLLDRPRDDVVLAIDHQVFVGAVGCLAGSELRMHERQESTARLAAEPGVDGDRLQTVMRGVGGRAEVGNRLARIAARARFDAVLAHAFAIGIWYVSVSAIIACVFRFSRYFCIATIVGVVGAIVEEVGRLLPFAASMQSAIVPELLLATARLLSAIIAVSTSFGATLALP